MLWQVRPWGGFDFSSWFWLLSSSSWLLLLSGGCVGPWEFLPGGIYLLFLRKEVAKLVHSRVGREHLPVWGLGSPAGITGAADGFGHGLVQPYLTL